MPILCPFRHKFLLNTKHQCCSTFSQYASFHRSNKNKNFRYEFYFVYLILSWFSAFDFLLPFALVRVKLLECMAVRFQFDNFVKRIVGCYIWLYQMYIEKILKRYDSNWNIYHIHLYIYGSIILLQCLS